MKIKICGFFDEFRFLSNFYPARVMMVNEWYPTTEHAYQAAKTSSASEREMIREAKTAGIAKRMGAVVEMRPDWDEVKVTIMYELTVEKFKDPVLRAKLLATQDWYLEETNSWGDKYWGVCDGEGLNMLGHTLMAVRNEIRKSMASL